MKYNKLQQKDIRKIVHLHLDILKDNINPHINNSFYGDYVCWKDRFKKDKIKFRNYVIDEIEKDILESLNIK